MPTLEPSLVKELGSEPTGEVLDTSGLDNIVFKILISGTGSPSLRES